MRIRAKFCIGAVLLLAVCCGGAAQQTKTDAELKKEADTAAQLYDKQNFVAALPLYEELHAQQPKNLGYQERLAMALLAAAGLQSPEEAKATRKRAKDLLLQAKAAGDDSGLVQVLLEKLADDNLPQNAAQPIGHEWVKKGEAAFSSGDLPGAMVFYQKALDANPNYYAAALFAGDVEYKQNHTDEAGKWFARAIAINPNEETAYRYWGDCLEKAGEHKLAEEKFIQAIVAQPYSRSPRVGLKQWAERNRALITPPPIKLPNRAEAGKNGGVNITVDGSRPDSEETSLGLMYSMSSALWQGEKFKKAYPNEKAYRHSLAEEMDGIRGMLTVMRELKTSKEKLGSSTKYLLDLEKDGMLECWILLDNPDQGIAQDYMAYRKEHRDLLAAYIAKYDVHPM